ncbi:di-trans,poly-cis-decaprenylcistransferase, partial [Desulfovibrio sp. OttesenSCG-928-G15]|nr:di-trans,poly-cis-decaprenylcistransferase [Desulfovibrio sp. OttesenSCG-928-G15]
REITRHCGDLGIKYLTLYTFSRENWKRPETEVRFLFDLLISFIGNELPSLEARGIRLCVLGEMDDLPFAVRKTLSYACQRTQDNTTMQLNLALNYSGRDEILAACRSLMQAGVKAEELTEKLFAAHLFTKGQPDPDLVIRTSGEQRLSNFLPFQTAYSELYFCDTLWPDFGPEEFDKALEAYSRRSRRFGGLESE